MQASGDDKVEGSLDIAYAGVGKFHVHAKFSIDGDAIFEIHPLQLKEVIMSPKKPLIAGDTMTCIFEATLPSKQGYQAKATSA